MLSDKVDASALGSPLRVIAGAGSFTLGHNQVHRVTVEAAPTETTPFSGTIMIEAGDPGYQTLTVTAKGRGKK